MVDIDEMIKMLLEQPSKELFYSVEEGRFLDVTKSKAKYYEDPDICSFCGAKVCWNDAKKVFHAKHKSVFSQVPSSYSVKKWNEIIKQEHLEDEWFKEFRRALASNVTEFTKRNGIQEVEASADLYEQIKQELAIFEPKHYEERYSDMVLFRLWLDYEDVPMTILGNAGTVFGMSFYPGDPDGNNFLLVQNQERLGIDGETTNSISNMVSFYFEDDDTLPYEIMNNPYGKDNHITSVYLCRGSIMNSYLPKSIAIRALEYLKMANKEMSIFELFKHIKIEDSKFYNVYLKGENVFVMKTDAYRDFTGVLPYDFDDVNFYDAQFKFTKRGAFDATIRYLPGYHTESFGEERCAHFSFVAIFCDHTSGYIHVNALGEAKNFRLFDELAYSLTDKLSEIELPKTIYVNNYLDSLFFNYFFEPYVEKGKINIKLSNKELKTDAAFESLRYFLERKMEEEDKRKNRKNRS